MVVGRVPPASGGSKVRVKSKAAANLTAPRRQSSWLLSFAVPATHPPFTGSAPGAVRVASSAPLSTPFVAMVTIR
jgi:hypothetical protein